MKPEDTFYSLCIEDIQTVAEQELERELTEVELQKVVDAIPDRIAWYDAIAATISEKIIDD